MPTIEFLEGRVRKQIELDEDPSRGQGDTAAEILTQEVVASPPQLAVEVDPQLLQSGEQYFCTHLFLFCGHTTLKTCFVRSESLPCQN
jgi:hypothetical protein